MFSRSWCFCSASGITPTPEPRAGFTGRLVADGPVVVGGRKSRRGGLLSADREKRDPEDTQNC